MRWVLVDPRQVLAIQCRLGVREGWVSGDLSFPPICLAGTDQQFSKLWTEHWLPPPTPFLWLQGYLLFSCQCRGDRLFFRSSFHCFKKSAVQHLWNLSGKPHCLYSSLCLSQSRLFGKILLIHFQRDFYEKSKCI